MITPLEAQAEYGVYENDVFLYDIITSEIDADIGTNSSSYSGCNIGSHVDVGEQFLVRVTYSSDTSIVYWQQYESYFQEYVSTPTLLYETLQWRFQTPVDMAYTFIEYWTYANTTYGEGLAIESIFFFDLNDNTWTEMKDALIRYLADMLETHTPYVSYDYDTKFKETRKEYRVEWFVSSTYYRLGLHDYTYSQGYKLVYSKINGALLGAHIKGHCEGVMNNVNFTLSYDQHVELADYNLDGFEIGEFKIIPGFGFMLTMSTLMILTIFIRKKRK